MAKSKWFVVFGEVKEFDDPDDAASVILDASGNEPAPRLIEGEELRFKLGLQIIRSARRGRPPGSGRKPTSPPNGDGVRVDSEDSDDISADNETDEQAAHRAASAPKSPVKPARRPQMPTPVIRSSKRARRG